MQSQTRYWWMRAWTSFQHLKIGECCLQASCSTCCWQLPCKGDDLMHAVLGLQSSQLCTSWWRTTRTLLRSYGLVWWNTWLPKGKLMRYLAIRSLINDLTPSRQVKQAAVMYGQLIMLVSFSPGVLYPGTFRWFICSVLEFTWRCRSLYKMYHICFYVSLALVDDNPWPVTVLASIDLKMYDIYTIQFNHKCSVTHNTCLCTRLAQKPPNARIRNSTVKEHTAREMCKYVYCLPSWLSVDVVHITPSLTSPIAYSGTEQNMRIMRDCVCPAPTLLHSTAVLQPNWLKIIAAFCIL